MNQVLKRKQFKNKPYSRFEGFSNTKKVSANEFQKEEEPNLKDKIDDPEELKSKHWKTN